MIKAASLVRLAAGVSVVPWLALAAPADAQTGAPSGDKLGEIVVTAQKRAENVQKVPAQVNVIGTAQLEAIHVTNLADIGAYVPGMQVNSGGTPGQTTISLRGIAPIGPAATVGSYIDETPVGSTSIAASPSSTGSSFSLDLLPYDVDHIEVLQGPQGTLYGANSIGGLIKYVLKTPSLDQFHASVGFDVFGVQDAKDAGGGGRVMLSVPLIRDKLAVLGSYGSESTPGYIDNVQTGQKDQNYVRQQSARFALLWQPETNLSVKLGFLWQNTTADGNANVPLDPNTLKPIAGDLKDNNYIAQPSVISLHHYSAQINWDFDWAKLISATSYSESSSTLYQDATRGIGGIFPLAGFDPGLAPFRQILATKKFTQEVRLSSPTSTHLEWQVGAFYTHEKTRNDQLEDATDLSGNPLQGLDPLFHAQLPDTYREYAVFGDATYHFTAKLDLAAGIRYAHNSQDHPITSTGFLTGDASVEGGSHEGVVTYSVGPRYQITDALMVYGRVASGYQAGGPNIPFPGVPPTVKSDTITNYELGLKSEFWDRRAIFNLALFWIDWKNIQILAFQEGTGFSYLDNGGKARSRGASADMQVKPISGVTLSGNITYTDAVLTQDVPTLGGLSGDELPYIPKLSGSVQADYGWSLSNDVKANLNAGLRVVGTRYSNVRSSPTAYRLAPYAAIDLGAAVTFSRYTARLFVKNLLDKRAYNFDYLVSNALSGATVQIESTPIQPRTAGIAFDAKF